MEPDLDQVARAHKPATDTCHSRPIQGRPTCKPAMCFPSASPARVVLHLDLHARHHKDEALQRGRRPGRPGRQKSMPCWIAPCIGGTLCSPFSCQIRGAPCHREQPPTFAFMEGSLADSSKGSLANSSNVNYTSITSSASFPIKARRATPAHKHLHGRVAGKALGAAPPHRHRVVARRLLRQPGQWQAVDSSSDG